MWIVILSTALGAGAGLACFQAAGSTLGLFFGGVIFAAILVPPLAVATNSGRAGALNALAVLAGIASVWWITGVSETGTNTLEWVRCTLVLFTFGGAVAAIAAAWRALRFSPAPVAAIAVLLGLAWLTWPIWLAT